MASTRSYFNKLLFASISILMIVYITIRYKNVFLFTDADYVYWGNYVLLSIELLIIVFIIFSQTNPFHGNALNRIIIVWICYMLVTAAINISHLPFHTIAVENMLWPLVYFLFYSIFKNKILSANSITTLFAVIIIINIYLFALNYGVYNFTADKTGQFSGINNVYFILLLLPWILLIENLIIRFIFLSSIFIAVGLSMKRTALIALILSVVYHAVSTVKSNKDGNKLIKLFTYSLLFISVTSFIAMHYYENEMTYFSRRFNDNIGAGIATRTGIWYETLNIGANSTIEEFLMGHGHDMVQIRNPLNMSAHNDWLEMYYDYGLTGLAIYFIFNITLIYEIWKIKSVNPQLSDTFVASIILFITISMFSHLFIIPNYCFLLSAFWGTCMGQTDSHRLGNRLKQRIIRRSNIVNSSLR